MPDWSYHTLTAPILRRMDHDAARRFVNGFFARAGRIWQGYRIVDLLGHMDPPATLAVTLPTGAQLVSRLALVPCIDPEGRGAAAFSRFGCGLLTFGPVAEVAATPRFRQGDDESLIGEGGAVLTLGEARRIEDVTGSARFAFEIDPFGHDSPRDAMVRLVDGLASKAAMIILSPQCFDATMAAEAELLEAFADRCKTHGVMPMVGAPLSDHAAVVVDHAPAWHALGMGLYLSGAPDDHGWSWGGEAQRDLAVARAEALADTIFLFVDGGVRSPREADRLRRAGADIVGIGPGLVHTGPGLCKRINETFLYVAERDGEIPEDEESPARRPWTWALVLGTAMLVGAVLAGWSALTHVLLPYDEAFLGRTSEEIAAFNPRVLHFMTHDRITLAGVMVSLGLLYTTLSVFAMRRGAVWAQHIVIASATTGFLSFFSFLGFGYLDPFHAFVATVMLQLLIQVIVRRAGPRHPSTTCPRLDNDGVWRAGLWGQLAFVLHGGALILAGLTILTFGMSVVFVPQDITYLGIRASDIAAFDEQLTSLIAHDRATFGGMLVSGGIALMLTSMWSFRHGDRWLLWTLFFVIFAPYAMTLWIHWDIGYRDHFHLSPVYVGVGLLALGMAASWRFLSGAPQDLADLQPRR